MVVFDPSDPPKGKTEAIAIRRGLSIYKQPKSPGRGSPYWYARAFIDGRSRTRTTQTTDERLAIKLAEDFYFDLQLERRQGSAEFARLNGRPAPSRNRVDRVIDQWLDQRLQEAGNDPRKLRRQHDLRQMAYARNGMAAFFGKDEVASITTQRIKEYLIFAAKNGRKGDLAPATKKAHIVALKGLLEFAFMNGMIPSVPLPPRVPQRDSPRGWFSRAEFDSLVAAAETLAVKADGLERQLWEELVDFLIVMVGLFLRPSEWTGLRLQDVAVRNEPMPHVWLNVTGGKTGARDVVGLAEAIPAIQRISDRLGGDPAGYLFLNRYPNRITARDKMRKLFGELVRAAGLEFDRRGRKRVIGCLRHTALTLRRLEGENVELGILADNAGTSVEQLERFYCSDLEPQMKIDNLLSVKPTGRTPPFSVADEIGEAVAFQTLSRVCTVFSQPKTAG